MKLTALFLLLPALLYAQNTLEGQWTGTLDAPYLQYGERYYRNSYNGLSQLMKELPAQDPELHGRLYPTWKQMRANQGWGIAAGVAGAIGGALIMLSPTADNTGITTLDPNARLRRVAWGAIVLGAGIGGSISLINRKEEVLKFINIFNAVSEGTKLQFSLTDSAGPGLGLIYWLD